MRRLVLLLASPESYRSTWSPATQPGLAIFNSSEFGDIRTVMKDGKPLFCAKDVAEALEYSDSDKAVRTHCRGAQTYPAEMTGQVRHVKFIPESDVYRLVMRSKLPGAERFQDWVMEEVLPTIRKTGRFDIAPSAQAVERGQELANQAEMWNTERRRIDPGILSESDSLQFPVVLGRIDAETTMRIAEQEYRETMAKSVTPEAPLGPVRQMCREDGRQREIFGFEEIPASPATQPGLAIFNSSEFGDIRTVMKDGKPLFCAKDVAVALGYSNTSKAIGDHCRGVTKRYTPTTSGHQEISFISEADVYRLVMRSKLPGAERFQDWVMEEVLPTIRKTGRFDIAPEVKQLTIRESLVLNLELLDKNEEQAKLLEEQRPAVEYHDNFLAAKDLYVTRDVAHSIGVPERKLIALLEERKILYRPAGPGTKLRAYGEYVTAGYFSAKPRPGREGYPMEVLFTPKGGKGVAVPRLGAGNLPSSTSPQHRCLNEGICCPRSSLSSAVSDEGCRRRHILQQPAMQ